MKLPENIDGLDPAMLVGATEAPTRLPVSNPRQVRKHVGVMFREHRRAFIVVISLHAVATAAALVGPALLGGLVQGLSDTASPITSAGINRVAIVFIIALVVQTIFTRASRFRAGVLGENVLANLRERFLARSVQLPPGVIERAGTGDLVTRATNDVDKLGWAVRMAVPEISIAAVSAVLILAALIFTAPVLALAWLLAVPPILISARWYFKRAPQAYVMEMATYADVNAAVAETADAGRTIEAYRLGAGRVAMTDKRIGRWVSWERYTMWLRTVWFPSVESAYVVPLAAVVAMGGLLYINGTISLAQMTAGVLYTQMLIEPVDMVLMWYDELQVAQASLARILGVNEVPDVESDSDITPSSRELAARDVHFGYREGRDVLHGVTLDVAPGSRIAVVGPSGAGKSTLGKLLAGLHAPGRGEVHLGGTDLSAMPPESARQYVALVTQEQHVFVGTVRDNLRLAKPSADDDELRAALHAVDADDWLESLPDGLDTVVGTGGYGVPPGRAQQIALARLVLADPHTLILDEATSLLDPRAARHLERSFAAVLDGRTVVAIAHRLSTAHDADHIAVVEDGRITESGSHDELVAANGPYAALWHSWRSEPSIDQADTAVPVAPAPTSDVGASP
jgi:ABC-type multidrug transport system fused ATPase/permease subunit